MAEKLLKKYQQMRDFGDTPEPSGAKTAATKRIKPIFVVQKHAASHLHYDFRLEMEGVLKSWAIPKGPSYDPGTKRLAMMTEDHPYDYAGFEGVIPEGNYGAGNVIIWDQGTWEFLEGDDPVKAVKKGKLTFVLSGKKLFGEWALVRIHGRSPKGNEWLLLKHRDQYAAPSFNITEEAPLSVVSGKDVTKIGGENQWQSNRKASSKKPRTMADVLREKKAAPAKPAAKKASSKRAATPRPSRPSSKKASTRRSGSSKS